MIITFAEMGGGGRGIDIVLYELDRAGYFEFRRPKQEVGNFQWEHLRGQYFRMIFKEQQSDQLLLSMYRWKRFTINVKKVNILIDK